MAEGLPGLPPPGFAASKPTQAGLPGLPAPGFASAAQSQPNPQSIESLLGEGATPLQQKGRLLAGGLTRLIPGFGDEITAGGSALVDALAGRTSLGAAYDQRLNEVRNYQQAFTQRADAMPGLNSFIDLGSALLLPGGSRVANRSSVFGKAAQGGAEGAGIAGLIGFGSAQGQGDRVDAALDAAKLGGPLGAFAGGAQGALAKMRKPLEKAGNAQDRASVGARASDYAKTADDLQTIQLPNGDLSSRFRDALDDLLSKGKLGKSRNPEKLIATSRKAQEKLASEVDDIIQSYDKAKTARIYPTFKNARDYLAKGKVPGDKLETYTRMLDRLEDNIKSEGKGALSYIQQQKVAKGTQYKPDDSTLNAFNRQIYKDLQQAIEQVVPEVKPLNRELGKYLTVEKMLQRSLGRSEADNLVKSAVQTLRTSGGFGVPMLAGTYLGNPVAGATLGALGYASQTPQGQRMIGQGLRTAGQAAGSLGNSQAISAGIPRLAAALAGQNTRNQYRDK